MVQIKLGQIKLGQVMRGTDVNTVNWDFETDLLVIGSGSAGLTAAVVGDQEGLDVIVLEKETFYGGTTALSGGVAWVPNNSLMSKAGIDDNPAGALAYLKHNIGQRVAASKLQAFVDRAPEMADYLMANSDLDFNLVHGFPDYRPETPGGSKGGRSIDPKVVSGRRLNDYDKLRKSNLAVPGAVVGSVTELRRLAFFRANPLGLLQVWKFFLRNLWNKLARREHLSGGRALIARLRLTLQKKNVPLWLETRLQEIILEDGAVMGVRAAKEGVDVNIRARKGVVMAAGGFERNPAMRKQFFGDKGGRDWNSGSFTSGSPGRPETGSMPALKSVLR